MLIFGATCTIVRAGAAPGAPGARREPQGADNRPKKRGRIYHLFLRKVGFVAAFWGPPRPKKAGTKPTQIVPTRKNPISVGQATGLSHTGGRPYG